jgi:hypothetical protein
MTYEDCILKFMPGTGSDMAAKAIIIACRKKAGQEKIAELCAGVESGAAVPDPDLVRMHEEELEFAGAPPLPEGFVPEEAMIVCP